MHFISHITRASILLGGMALLVPGSAFAQGARTEALIEEATTHIGALRAGDAEAALQRARQMSPDDPNVLNALGGLRRYTGERSESIRLLQAALNLDPENPGRFYQLGISFRYVGNLDGATVLFRRAIALSPTAGNAHAQLGFTEIVRGNRDAAVRELQVAEHLFGEDIPDWRLAQLAFAYAQIGHRNDVRRLFSALEEKEDPVDDAVWAMAYIALGDYGQAAERLRAAITDPAANGGITVQLLAEIAANAYSDPALYGPGFQELLSGMWTTS